MQGSALVVDPSPEEVSSRAPVVDGAEMRGPAVESVGERSAHSVDASRSMDARLERVKAAVEGMPKARHIEVLKILTKSTSAKINENRSGIYVNMSFLSETIVCELESYVKRDQDQEDYISLAEATKAGFKQRCKNTGMDIVENNIIRTVQ